MDQIWSKDGPNTVTDFHMNLSITFQLGIASCVGLCVCVVLAASCGLFEKRPGEVACTETPLGVMSAECSTNNVMMVKYWNTLLVA